MSLNNVKEYLKKYNMDNEILEFNQSSATVKEAAIALNIDEDMIAKSLSFKLKDKCILIVMSGNSRVDNSKYKEEFKEKAKMIEPDLVEELIGHKVGGVCPFAVKDEVDIYLDESLKKYEYVYPACGSSNSAIKISINKLEEIVPLKKWIDISK